MAHKSFEVIATPSPDNVLDKSIADISFLAGMLVDKFMYHSTDSIILVGQRR